MSRYKKYLDKIIYSPFKFEQKDHLNFTIKPTTTDYSAPQWQVEYAQRNYITTATKIFSPDDILIISDVDEIPKLASVDYAKSLMGKEVDSMALGQEMFYYNFNKKQNKYWLGSIVTTNRFAQKQTPQWLRDMRTAMPRMANAGWHLSYWTTPEGIEHKIKNFSHQEFNTPDLNNRQNILNSIANSEDLFNKQLELISVAPTEIDFDVYNIFNKYSTQS